MAYISVVITVVVAHKGQRLEEAATVSFCIIQEHTKGDNPFHQYKNLIYKH